MTAISEDVTEEMTAVLSVIDTSSIFEFIVGSLFALESGVEVCVDLMEFISVMAI
jgi:hypothetical protein